MKLWLMQITFVAAGSAVGGTLRYLIARVILTPIPQPWMPWGTLIANGLGCFVLGALLTLCQRFPLPGAWLGLNVDAWRLLVGVGFCGGLTTLSTMVWEAYSEALVGEPTKAVGYVALTLAVGFAAVIFGAVLAHRLPLGS